MFQDVAETHEPYTDSEETGSESEEITDDDDDESFDEEDDMTEGSEFDEDEDFDHESISDETGENKFSEKVSISLICSRLFLIFDH